MCVYYRSERGIEWGDPVYAREERETETETETDEGVGFESPCCECDRGPVR